MITKIRDREFFYKYEEQLSILEKYAKMMQSYPNLEFYRPSMSSPWHWQTNVNGTKINMWPHLNKWQVEPEKSSTGLGFLKIRIDELLLGTEDDIELIEDC